MNTLPIEIWQNILVETDIRSICTLSLTTKKVHKLLECDYFWKRKTRHDFGCFKNTDGTPVFPGVFKEDLYSFKNSWKEFYFGIQRFLDLIFNEDSLCHHEFPSDSSKWQKHFYGVSLYLAFERIPRKFQGYEVSHRIGNRC